MRIVRNAVFKISQFPSTLGAIHGGSSLGYRYGIPTSISLSRGSSVQAVGQKSRGLIKPRLISVLKTDFAATAERGRGF